jgi:hypothetical protein
MKTKMIPRWAFILAAMLVAIALMTGVALARTGGGGMSSATGNHSLSGTMDQPDATMLNGGHYQLTGVTLGDAQGSAWQASGGGYHLQGLAGPQLTGSGCCCTYLPCLRR